MCLEEILLKLKSVLGDVVFVCSLESLFVKTNHSFSETKGHSRICKVLYVKSLG